MDFKEKSLELINNKYEEALLNRNKSLNWLKNNIKKYNMNVCIFSCGKTSIDAYFKLKKEGIIVDCFSDNDNKWHGKVVLENKICIAPERIDRENTIIIVATIYIDDIWEQLKKMKFNYLISIYEIYYLVNNNFDQSISKEELLKNTKLLFDILADEESKKFVYFKLNSMINYQNCFNIHNSFKPYNNTKQYFPSNINFSYKKGAFVDCGAYDGDTLNAVCNDILWDNSRYVCYELDEKNFCKLKKYIDQYFETYKNKIDLYNMGVGKEKCNINYLSLGTESKIVCNKDAMQGILVKISEHLKNENVGYIKMDIEGAEMDALIGAEKLIKEQKPVLGICLYHKFSDLWTIPLYIKKIVPEYKIYIRHHTDIYLETVCYATL